MKYIVAYLDGWKVLKLNEYATTPHYMPFAETSSSSEAQHIAVILNGGKHEAQ